MGRLRESLDSLLALRGGAFAARHTRVVLRMVTPTAADPPGARERARRVLDRFVVDFGSDLEALDETGS
jgi:hypothetical protein